MLDVCCSIQVSVCAVATDPTAKRLLVGPVGLIWIVAHAALLRSIGALDPDGGDAPLGTVPGDLLGDMRQIGGVQVGVHGARFVLHGGNREVFVGDLCALVLVKALVDRAIDLLTDVAAESLP